jgi:hypothetical protein
MNDEVNSVACRHIAGKPPRARLQTEICAQQKPGSRSSPIRNGFYIGGERDGQTCTEGTGV